jgi:hypothetical protein
LVLAGGGQNYMNEKMKKYIFAIIMIISTLISNAQEKIKFESTASVGSFSYFFGFVDVCPFYGSEYDLPRTGKTGIQVSISNGICIKDKLHFGLGIGYANYDGINGLMGFSDNRIDFSKKPFAMFFYFDPGYSHFWSQYALNNSGGGTGTFMIDFGLGARYKVFNTRKAIISTGLLLMQQNIYIPLKLGFTF